MGLLKLKAFLTGITMPIGAFIFDLDGTLLDSIGDIAASGNTALAELEFPTFPVDRYRAFVGDGVANLARKVLPEGHRDEETVKRFLGRFKEQYSKSWNKTTRPYPGIVELLSALAERGVHMGIVSNKRDEFTKACVRELLPRSPFGEVRGESESTPVKPDPSGTIAVAQALGCAPSSCVFVGDSEVDAETARRAGMRFVAVEWGYRSRAQLEAAGVSSFVREPGELLRLLDGE